MRALRLSSGHQVNTSNHSRIGQCLSMLPILVSVIAGLGAVAAAPADHYQSRYDHVDLESILNNRRMVSYYAACLLSQGPCTPQGLELRHVLPEALQTSCAKCTEKQKTGAYRTIKRLKKEYPKIWEQLVAFFDPNEVQVQKFETMFENKNAVDSPPQLFDRFGGDADESSSATNTKSAAPSTSSSTTSTTIRTTTSTSTSTSTTTSTPLTSTKPTTKPSTNRPITFRQPTIFVTRAPQTSPFANVGANLQATVTFVAALKQIVIELYQHKVEVINGILSGRY